jgi:hypothetical protein
MGSEYGGFTPRRDWAGDEMDESALGGVTSSKWTERALNRPNGRWRALAVERKTFLNKVMMGRDGWCGFGIAGERYTWW